eukprot:s1070_g17.t2
MQLLSGAAEAAAVMDAEAQAVDAEVAEEGADEHHLDEFADDHARDEYAEGGSGDEIDPALHSSWMFLQDSCSEDEGAEGADRRLPGSRVRAFKDRPEFAQLESEGLTDRPAGCTVGVHPAGKQWRAYTEDSTYFGRSWGVNRTPRQALLRVFQLMLEAYCAKHKHDRLAKRQLDREKVMGSNLLRYAFTERNILSYIQHPYIVSLHYAFQTPKHLVLVMQYCPGGNLQQLIRRLGRKLQGLSMPLAQLYAAELLLALQHLHERNIVYRDLKPDNVVLDAAGHAILTDFGLSKDGVRRHLGTRTHCGSVAYLAPEILLGQKYGHTVDIYNLGVLVYNMLLGLPPFFHHEKETLQRNIVHAQLELPSILSTAAQSFIHVTMAREPRKRLGAASTGDLRRHEFFRDMNFELLKLRKVPLPERLPPPDADPKAVKPGRPPKVSTLQALHRGAVPGWDFEAPKAMVECQGSSPCRPRRWRFRLCGLKW